MNFLRWIAVGQALWWAFAGVVFTFAGIVIVINLRAFKDHDPGM